MNSTHQIVEFMKHPLWGSHTESSSEHYVSGPTLGSTTELVNSYLEIKRACALANEKSKKTTARKARAITDACDALIASDSAHQFPTAIMSGGGGTASNMNVNEVVANLANLLHPGAQIHANDDVNQSQSSNDTYPSAVSIYLTKLVPTVENSIRCLIQALNDKADQYEGVLHLGRTCLNDAVKLPISATHKAQAAGLKRTLEYYKDASRELRHLPLGGTAVGSGKGAPENFGAQAIDEINLLGAYNFEQAPDLYDAMSNSDTYFNVGAALAGIGINIGKLARDVRLLGSGPGAGFGEIEIPVIQPGSSIMPGKINPMILELANACMIRVKGNAEIVRQSADAGELEINTMLPVMVRAIGEMVEDISGAAATLAKNCIQDMEWNDAKVSQNLTFSYDEKVDRALDEGYDNIAFK